MIEVVPRPPSVAVLFRPRRGFWWGRRRRRAAARRERQARAAWLEPPFPIFGLSEEWSGLRTTGGWGGSYRGIHTLALRHRDANVPPNRSLIVESSIRQPFLPDEEPATRWLVENRLWRSAFRPPRGLPPEGLVRWATELDAKLAARPDPEWQDAEVSVDGRRVPVRCVAEGSSWLAVGHVGGVTLTLEGTNFPLADVRLVRLTDARAYLDEPEASRPRSRDGSAGS
jgi:hypothetical protein